MDLFSGIIGGFQVCLQPINLLYCFIGVTTGTLIGVLPGIGPTATLAILLPSTLGVSPATAIIMLAGIYYGAMYGGSTTAILVNVPGEAASIITCLDGYQMARKGRAGVALGISAIGSFIGGTFSVIALSLLVFPLAQFGLKFGPPEFFSLIVLSMTLVTYMARGSMDKALIMVLVGLILSTVGLDLTSGVPRFTFGIPALLDGAGIVPVAMGLFGIAEVLENIESLAERSIFETKITQLLPSRQDWRRSIGPIGRASLLGFFLGLIPGVGGATPAPILSYSIEKRISKNPHEFGHGAIEGVAGPEAANNAATGAAFVPLLALGIPSHVVMAILFGALIIHGVPPGPMLLVQHPDIFWGVISSMYVGNCMLLLLNLPLIGIWVKILKIPPRILMPLIIFFCLIGAYATNNNIADVTIMIFFGIFGYVMRKIGYDAVPFLMGFILGPLIETSFRQSMIMSDGKFSIFLQRPITVVVLMISALVLISSGFLRYLKPKEKLL